MIGVNQIITGIIIILLVTLLIVWNNTADLSIIYCKMNGFTYEKRFYNNEVRGYCLFNNSECLASAYYNGSCKPGDIMQMNCSPFINKKVCSQELSPVCARIQVGVTKPFKIIEEEWGNACSACINSRNSRKVLTYVNKSC